MSSTLFCLGFIFGFVGSQSISSYILRSKSRERSEYLIKKELSKVELNKIKPLLKMVIKTKPESESDSESYELGNYNYNTYKN